MTTEQETEPDWAARQTDRVIDVIDKVKAQTTDRAVTVLRAVVFGVVIAVLGVAAATIFDDAAGTLTVRQPGVRIGEAFSLELGE